MDALFKLIQQFVGLDPTERKQIAAALQVKKVAQGEFLVKEGQVCQYLAFLTKGIMRVYTTVDGREDVSHFCFERRNPIVCAHISFISRRPSMESIQALEDTELWSVTYDQLQQLYTQSPKFQLLGRLMMEQTYIDAKLRILALKTEPAAARYQKMLEKYPTLLNRIPHHYVASYLGIAPESLSRIRRQLLS